MNSKDQFLETSSGALGSVCASEDISYGLDGALLKSDRESCFSDRRNYLELLSQDGESNLANESLELVVIDSQVADIQTLIDNLSGITEVIILDEQTDGLQQISNSLSQYEDVKAIHLVSHGDAGQLFLGNTQLNANNLSQYTELLATWDNFLTEDADLLLYGCDLGSTDEGIAFLEEFSQLTNVDILIPNGNLIGSPGVNNRIRVVQGDINDALSLFDRLTQGGTVATGSIQSS